MKYSLSEPKGLITLNDAQLDHVGGGWDTSTASGVLTAMLKVSHPPPQQYTQVLNLSPISGVTPGQGTFTAATAPGGPVLPV